MLQKVQALRVRPLLLLATIAVGCGDDGDRGQGGEPAVDRGAAAENAGDGGAVAEASPADATTETPVAAAVTYEESRQGLQKLVADLLASIGSGGDPEESERLMRSLRLPDPEGWFRAHFRRRIATRLLEEYEPILEEIGQMKQVLAGNLKKGLLGVKVERFKKANDPAATGYQSKALAAMKDPVALYSVRLMDDPQEKAFHLWSFVHEGGTFRFVGKMKRVLARGPPKDDERDLYEFRVADAKRIELARKLEELKQK